eukprot:scaffold101_cov90-Isochrysis_galbana.AAC.2
MWSRCRMVTRAALGPKSLPSVAADPSRRKPSSTSGAAKPSILSRPASAARMMAQAVNGLVPEPKRKTSSGDTLRPSTSPATSVKLSLSDTQDREIATPRSRDCSVMSDCRRLRRLRRCGMGSIHPPSHHATF